MDPADGSDGQHAAFVRILETAMSKIVLQLELTADGFTVVETPDWKTALTEMKNHLAAEAYRRRHESDEDLRRRMLAHFYGANSIFGKMAAASREA
jgi:hypothetical protein